MKLSSLCLLVAALAGAAPAGGQTVTRGEEPAPPVVTVCDLLRAPLEYDGRLIRVQGRVTGTDEGSWLVSNGCPGVLVTEGHVWPTAIALTAPGEAGAPHPLGFDFDKESGRKYNRSYKRLLRRVPEQCMVTTLTGLFETRRDWSRFKVVYRNGTWKFIGFGHLGEAPGQLVIKSEDGHRGRSGVRQAQAAQAIGSMLSRISCRSQGSETGNTIQHIEAKALRQRRAPGPALACTDGLKPV